MSRRDVDLEFEQAYQRLFSTSSSSAAEQPGPSTSSGKRDVRSQSSQQPTRSQTSKEVGGAKGPSGHARQRLLALASQRKASAGRTHSHSLQRRHIATPASRSEEPPQHHASAAAKGKGRARPNTNAEHRHADPHVPASIPDTASAPYGAYAPPASMAYYPFTQSHAPLHAPGHVVAPGMTAIPNPTIAWTQPMMPAGSVPAIAYPGFSASVTFSQPQFFASHPHPVHASVMPPPPAGSWPGLVAPAPSQPPQASASKVTNRVAARKRTISPLDAAHRGRKRQQPSASADYHPSSLKSQAREQPRTIPHVPAAENIEFTSKALKAELDDGGVPIRRPHGRPPGRPKASLPSRADVVQARPESRSHSPAAAKATTAPAKFDGCLPLREHAGRPQNRETHTLFIHASRRLLWLAKLAVAQSTSNTKPSFDTRAWARWSNSIAARLHVLSAEPDGRGLPLVADDELSSASQSQADPAGLFPRHRRRAYVGLRKQEHAAARTAVMRICIRRLRRYLASTAAKASTMPQANRTAYLTRKVRVAKLERKLHRALRPAPLDARALWSHWAHTRTAVDSHSARIKVEDEEAAGEPSVGVKVEPSDGVVTPSLPKVPEVPDALAARTHAPLFLRRNFTLYRLLGMHTLPLD